MNYIFYNPETMQNPGTVLTYVCPADTSDKFTEMKLKFRAPYKSRADALSETSSAEVYFYEDGILYRAIRVGAWQWKPCEDVERNSGINWNTYYAQTIERLQEYLTDIYGKLYNFKPMLNANGLYEVQVHYDGRCR